MTPVRALSLGPGGSSGLTAYPSIGPDTAGVKAMASPTTAGKGCDPLYDSSGGGTVAGSPPPQAQSHDRPMNTPTRRIGIIPSLRLSTRSVRSAAAGGECDYRATGVVLPIQCEPGSRAQEGPRNPIATPEIELPDCQRPHERCARYRAAETAVADAS